MDEPEGRAGIDSDGTLGWVGTVRRGAHVLLLGVLAACGRGPSWDIPEPAVDPCADNACISVSTLQRAVDILFVIDNSGSMGVEQGTLAANFPAFIDVLEAQRFGASYRIGLTTTDARGNLRVSSCRERLPEFVFDDNAGTVIDEQQSGCLASCAFDTVATVPTANAADAEVVSRPWIENDGGETNLDGGLAIADAMRCAGPQGINGSGFEAPLESMRQVLRGEGTSRGFLRDEALLAIVFVTDETDCSASDENVSLLIDPVGAALWTDPEQATSGACWKAGTSCTGGPGIYDECRAVDKGLDGQPTDGEPILYPVERYVDTLVELSNAKATRGGTGQILVGVIGGVPLDYPETGVMIYQDSDDPEFNIEYGIGPSCGRGTETTTSPPGIPPVRLAEFATQFAADERNLFSICAGDYTVALQQIVDALGRLSARTCVPGCVADYDDDEPGLQPSCRLVERDESGVERVVPRCVVTADGWSFPGTSPALCFRPLLDAAGATPSPADDLSAQCVTQGANVELVVERPDGILEAQGTVVDVECALTGPVGTACTAQ
jgi:hypothetical protein